MHLDAENPDCVPSPLSPSLWVGCHTGHRPRPRAGWIIREITVDPTELVVVDGIRATSPIGTCFDCARWLSQPDAVIVVDALCRLEAFGVEDVAS